jgi:simple sugar transport system ATP-binding protein
MTAPALELREVTKRFGRVVADDRVSLAVLPGTIHAIVGENGAGKSTAMRIAYGMLAPDSGAVAIGGVERRLAGPEDAIRLGVGMVHQHFLLVDAMSVAENVVLGAEPGRPWALDRRGAAARIAALAAEVGLPVDPTARVGDLSVGLQQRVELLKALFHLDARNALRGESDARNALRASGAELGAQELASRVLILDEPTAVMTPQEVVDFFAFLRRLRARGETVVLITHKLSEVLAISDEVTVMRDGRVVGGLATRDTTPPELARLMVGREVLLRVEKGPARPGPAVLEVRDLAVAAPGGAGGARRVDGASFAVRAGEIVGIAGVEGNGQTELVEAIAGLADPARPARVTGSVRLAGEEIVHLSARARRERGLAHVPEDRLRRGLILDFTLAENAVLGVQHLPPISRGPLRALLDRAAIGARARAILDRGGVRPADPDLPARALSGGNQQKLVVERELALPPRLLLVAQPTRGVDIGAIEAIHRELVAHRDRGAAILLVSSELEEVTALADRLLVMAAGRIVAELDPARATAEEIGLLMAAGRAA